MNCSNQRPNPSYCKNKFFNKFEENLKTLQGGFKVYMFIRVVFIHNRKKAVKLFYITGDRQKPNVFEIN